MTARLGQLPPPPPSTTPQGGPDTLPPHTPDTSGYQLVGVVRQSTAGASQFPKVMRQENDSMISIMMGGADSRKTVIHEADALRGRTYEIVINKSRHSEAGHPGSDFHSSMLCKAD